MKTLTVISGKGGTGKTSLVGSFAALNRGSAVLVDADVDAANLSLITRPELIEKNEFKASRFALVEREQCDSCGLCRELCRFAAISEKNVIDPVKCEGCGFCSYVCPAKAIRMVDKVSGHWFVSRTPYGLLVHARLGVAEENSGKLVTTIRNKARQLAELNGREFLVIDGPPGIGCPVIASLAGTDAALVVTEPTVSGIHDLERVLVLCRHFTVPALVCINRSDLNEDNSAMIEKYCRDHDYALAGRIPYDRVFTDAMVAGVPVVEFSSGTASSALDQVWHNITAAWGGCEKKGFVLR